VSYLERGVTKNNIKTWAFWITDAMRESVNADVGIHAPSLTGEDFPEGNVNRWDLVNGHPRVFEFGQPKGWKVYTGLMNGALFKTLIQAAATWDFPLTFSGVSYKVKRLKNEKRVVYGIRVNGRRVNPLKRYKIAVPEGIARGGEGISKLTRLLVQKTRPSNIFFWEAMEKKFSDSQSRLDENYLYRLRRNIHTLYLPENF